MLGNTSCGAYYRKLFFSYILNVIEIQHIDQLVTYIYIYLE